MNDHPSSIDQLARPAPIEGQAPEPREAWRSEELLGERAEVMIVHNNEVYRLRRTRQGKLILYK
jgi:hemin uptake protein HemP